MARYKFIIEGEVTVDTPRTPEQIRAAFVDTMPSFRQKIKTAFRETVALDTSGNTVIVKWVLHTDNVTPVDGGADIDLDEGATEETE